MTAPFDIITFDCYGTLIDWRSGIFAAFADAAAGQGAVLDRAHTLALYARFEQEVELEPYRCYRDVLSQAALRVAKASGWDLPPEHGDFLARSLPLWTPFPDTNPALERLRAAGYRLGILSNIDDDLLDGTRRHFTVDFELVITAQQVKSYKPALPHFLVARERVGTGRWLHAAQSNFHDIVPTNALGIPNAWINRRHQEPLPGGAAAREFESMELFAAAMAPERAPPA
jgi:2-haloalkanoic acid dehalogenase type II